MAKIDSEHKKEDWMNSKWRPMMGWSYMLTCVADFVLFPILWSLLQALSKGSVQTQWQPITLQGAGLYHIAMGAVLGIAAMGRTQEKLAGANNGNGGTTNIPSGGSAAPSAAATTGFNAPSSVDSPAASGFGGGFGGATPTPITPAPSWGTTPIAATGFGSDSAAPVGFADPIATTANGKKIVPDFPQPTI